MAITLIQSGTDLQLLNDAGLVSTPLALPTGVTLRTDVPPRMVVFGKYVILTNTPSQPLIIDAFGVVRLLSPKAPRLAPILSAASGGSLTGTYAGVRATFVTVDDSGNLITESDFSPPSNSQAVSSQFLVASNLDISPDQITGRRLYRPTTLGAVNFQWVDLDGNVLTSVQDDLSDAGLSTVSAPILGTPPDLTLIAEYKDRLFGVGRIDIDDLRYTEVGLMYAWPADNVFPIPPVGSDSVGIRGLIPRRESLGIGRQNQLLQLTGSDDTTFAISRLSQNLGVSSQESVVVYRDVAYFLWEDGVYSWSDGGIQCLSDGKVRSWFTTDDTFNRSRFQYAFACIDPIHFKYRLFLYEAGSTSQVRWVEFDLIEQTWWGPHLTTAFTPTSSFIILDGNLVPKPIMGGFAGSLYGEQETRTDDPTTPIVIDVVTKPFSSNAPDLDKFWGEVTVIGKEQPAGAVDVTLSVGELDSDPSNVVQWDMTSARQRLQRAGTGKHLQIELQEGGVGQDVQIYGLEINPVNLLGRR